MDVGRRLCLECREVLIESFPLRSQFDDPALGERDDGMAGIVVLFEAERLPVERAIEIPDFPSAPRDLRFVLLPATSRGAGEVFTEKLEPAGAEQSGGEDVEQLGK